MLQLNDEIDRVIEDFNKQFVQYYPGDSGFNGNDPQEPNEEVQADAEELRDWLRFTAKSIAEKTVEAVRVENKYNLITQKRRLTYSDVDYAYNQAVAKQSKLADQWLGKDK